MERIRAQHGVGGNGEQVGSKLKDKTKRYTENVKKQKGLPTRSRKQAGGEGIKRREGRA